MGITENQIEQFGPTQDKLPTDSDKRHAIDLLGSVVPAVLSDIDEPAPPELSELSLDELRQYLGPRPAYPPHKYQSLQEFFEAHGVTDGDTMLRELQKVDGWSWHYIETLLEDSHYTFHAEVAADLISANHGFLVTKNISNFAEADHERIADYLRATPKGIEHLIDNIDKFVGIDRLAVLQQAVGPEGQPLDRNVTWTICQNIAKFPGADTTKIINRIIDQSHDNFMAVREFLSNVRVDASVAYTLAERRIVVIDDLYESFDGLDYNRLAQIYIDNGYTKSGNLSEIFSCRGLNETIADQIIEQVRAIDRSWLLKDLINNVSCFTASAVDHIIESLLCSSHLDVKNWLQAAPEYHAKIAEALIDNKLAKRIVPYFDVLAGVDIGSLISRVIATGQTEALDLLPDVGAVLDSEQIMQIQGETLGFIIYKHGGNVFMAQSADSLKHFIREGNAFFVVTHQDKFPDNDCNDIMRSILDLDGRANVVGYALRNMSGLDDDIARSILGAVDSAAKLIIDHIGSFTDPVSVGEILRENGYIAELIDAKDKFPEIKIEDELYTDSAYTYLAGGFSRKVIGEIVHRRIDQGIEGNLHDASQWLEDFQIPERWIDIDALKGSDWEPDDTLDDYKVSLRDEALEVLFMRQLLEADSDLRVRLTYGNAPRRTTKDKLAFIFRRLPESHKEFSVRLGQAQSALSSNIYDAYIAENGYQKQWEDFVAKGNSSQKRFLNSVLSDGESQKLHAAVCQNAVELRTSLEVGFVDAIFAEHPELLEEVDSGAAKNGERWFFSPEHQLLYRAACSDEGGQQLYKQPGFSVDMLFGRAHAMIDDFCEQGLGGSDDGTGHRMTKDELTKRLNKAFERLVSDKQTMQTHRELSEEELPDWKVALKLAFEQFHGSDRHSALASSVTELSRLAHNRDRYVRDTQAWLRRHATANSAKLHQAWGDRAQAIFSDTPDSLESILAWQRVNALPLEIDRMEANGELQAGGINRRDINDNPEIVAELIRKLSAKDTILAMQRMKKWRDSRDWQDKVLPAQRLEVEANGKQYAFEILDKDDPRGFTLGEDTACCMTINGESKSCIKAGYSRQNAGFLGVYEAGGDLLAQSFWYVHPQTPHVLVLDNIEANEGRDIAKLVEVYKEALAKYLGNHPELGITEVRVGTGYSDANLEGLEWVDHPMVIDGIYTDADSQRVLLRAAT